MNSQVAVATITSFASLTIAVAGIPLNYLIGRRMRHEQSLDIVSRYRDPLLQAADDLRGRLIFILDLGDDIRNRKLMEHITIIRADTA